MKPAACFVLVLLLFAASGYAIVQHARAGDLLSFSWGPTPEERFRHDRDLADYKLDSAVDTLEGIHSYTGSYDAHEILWKPELKLVRGDETGYCIEVTVRGRLYHRSGPGRSETAAGVC